MRPAWKVQLPKGVKAVGGIQSLSKAVLSAFNHGFRVSCGSSTSDNNENNSNQL